jgi:dTDP-4-dehydrorhamnose reductase
MKVLITGANGFLGYYLTALLLERKHTVTATGKGTCRLPFSKYTGFSYVTLDFTDPMAAKKTVDEYSPDAIVHAGAWSKPDECELHQEKARNVNVNGTVNMLSAAKAAPCFFLFLSTDFIFEGTKGIYSESDAPGPVNFYGQTKLEAENAVRQYPYEWSIVRTILVYGKTFPGRSNILTIVKEKLEKGEEYRVVNDQVRTPTYVEDLAKGIVTILEKRAAGVFHLSGTDTLTPYEMAGKTADYLGLDKTLLKKVTAANFTQPARRPARTCFEIGKAKKELNYTPVSFEEGLKKTFG